VNSQARHTAVGINLEPQMRDATQARDREAILRVTRKRRFRQQRAPRRCGIRKLLGAGIAVCRATFHFALLGIISLEGQIKPNEVSVCVKDWLPDPEISSLATSQPTSRSSQEVTP